LIDASDIPTDIKEIMKQREAARADKNWKEADKLRDKLAEQGYSIEDTTNGPQLVKNK